MTRRVLSLLVLLAALATPLAAQAHHAALDTLVQRITRGWAVAPCTDGCVQWTVMHGDSTALRADGAEISGSDRTGTYTITLRPARFAAPTLVGRLRLQHERRAIVARRAIARGATLTPDDVMLAPVRTIGAPDSTLADITDLGAVLGTETRRALAAGETVRALDVRSAPVVMAGDSVTAEFVRDGVRLALAATALQTASLGERVAIRLDRGRRFAGIATGRNTVRLDR